MIGYIEARLYLATTMGESLPTEHLPFQMPSRKHALTQEWRDLTFMHWKVEIEKFCLLYTSDAADD